MLRISAPNVWRPNRAACTPARSKRTAAGFGVAVPIELPSQGEMQR